MEFVNESNVEAGWTMGFERDGRELLIVAVKATYTIPRENSEPQLAEEQVPLVESDEFTGEPGLSAPRYECDYAHRKPMCDVLLNGSAYAPPGKVVRQTGVGLRVGSLVKTLTAVGNRVWNKGVWGITASEPEPFDVMPITYDTAFGGEQFWENPVGRGYARSRDLAGQPLPNTEETSTPVTDPGRAYRPMSMGPIGRNWRPRVNHAGTYDEPWLKGRAPFWPDDFSYSYFQAAPPEQQIPYPVGGEQVVLRNLTADGYVAFGLPPCPMPVWFIPHRGNDICVNAVVDTLLIEPDAARFMMTWRATLAMRHSCFDMKQVIAGQMSDAWQRQRKHRTKPYYKSLGELAAARRGRR